MASLGDDAGADSGEVPSKLLRRYSSFSCNLYAVCESTYMWLSMGSNFQNEIQKRELYGKVKRWIEKWENTCILFCWKLIKIIEVLIDFLSG